jgi:hypothetical protein
MVDAGIIDENGEVILGPWIPKKPKESPNGAERPGADQR